MARPTAACLIIGDEILTGKVHDRNSHELAKALFEQGIELACVLTLPDKIDALARAVADLAAAHDYVFTSGGVGPTHDDVTFEAVARAFGRKLAPHEETLARMEAYYRAKHGSADMLNEARRKMALVPEGATVRTPTKSWVPVVRVENVFVLPGVPGLFQALIEPLVAELEGGVRLHRIRIYTLRPEGDVAQILSEADAAHPGVAIGSYPHYDAEDHKVMVTFEGEDPAEVEALADEIAEAISGFYKPDA